MNAINKVRTGFVKWLGKFVPIGYQDLDGKYACFHYGIWYPEI